MIVFLRWSSLVNGGVDLIAEVRGDDDDCTSSSVGPALEVALFTQAGLDIAAALVDAGVAR